MNDYHYLYLLAAFLGILLFLSHWFCESLLKEIDALRQIKMELEVENRILRTAVIKEVEKEFDKILESEFIG